MNGGTTLPVVIGISAGIAMIVIFALLVNHHLKLSIEGLKHSYRVGEQITFTLRYIREAALTILLSLWALFDCITYTFKIHFSLPK